MERQSVPAPWVHYNMRCCILRTMQHPQDNALTQITETLEIKELSKVLTAGAESWIQRLRRLPHGPLILCRNESRGAPVGKTHHINGCVDRRKLQTAERQARCTP